MYISIIGRHIFNISFNITTTVTGFYIVDDCSKYLNQLLQNLKFELKVLVRYKKINSKHD